MAVAFHLCGKCGLPREARRCRECAREYQRQYRATRDPAKIQEYTKRYREKRAADPVRSVRTAAQTHAYKLLTKYGLTVEQYEQRLVEQEHCCAICLRSFETLDFKHVHVDHDHRTGAVRGLLCMYCNTALGKFGDDPEVLARAILYLRAASMVDA